MEATSANLFCRASVYADIGNYDHAIKGKV